MSAGHFNFMQRHMTEIASDIEEVIDHNTLLQIYAADIIEEFKNGVQALRRAYVYAERIDYLLEGDDGEDSFRKRLKEDLAKLKG